MTDITQTADIYPEGVYQLAVTDPVLGGPDGPDNKAAIALANRTNYQRMRNVTPWRPGLGNEYPAHSYVQYGGVTWKSTVAVADIEPGTDAAKWIRWGYTADELLAYLDGYIASGVLDQYALDIDLAAYLLKSEFDAYVFNKGIRYSATVCPNGGPALAPMNIAAPTLAVPFNVYKSALGEIWMYLDNAWRVVAGHYGVYQANDAYAMGTSEVSYLSFVAPRAGKITAAGYFGRQGSAAATLVFTRILLNTKESGAEVVNNVTSGQRIYLNSTLNCEVAAGDVVAFSMYTSTAQTMDIRVGVAYS